MGYGDELIASGIARGAADRGKRVAFGNRVEIIWTGYADKIFAGNPNVAPPGSERDKDIEWSLFCRGNRMYNQHDMANNRWIWKKFKPIPGQVYFTTHETHVGAVISKGRDFVIIEPNTLRHKVGVANKQWPQDRYQEICDRFVRMGVEVLQFHKENDFQLKRARVVAVATFRQMMAVMNHARMFVGPEGGMHHAAAAAGIPAVVLFGGWVPPWSTGYEGHDNISVGEPCGSLAPCPHCAEAMNSISVDRVWAGAAEKMNARAA